MRPGRQAYVWVFVGVSLFPSAVIAAPKVEPPPTVTVQRGLLRIVVRTAGTVAPFSEIPIPARAAGEITSAPVEIGQNVKKGQRLLVLDPGPYHRAVERAQADLMEAEANLRIAELRAETPERDPKQSVSVAKAALDAAEAALTEARAEFERVNQLRKKDQATDQELLAAQKKRDDALARRDSARTRKDQTPVTTGPLELQRQELALRQAAVSRAKVAVETARADLSKTSLLSPMDGMITERSVKQGGFIAPAVVDAGTPLFVVSDLSKIAVVAEIGEEQIRDIQPNLAATVYLPAVDRHFQGRVVSVSPRAQSRAGKSVFAIRVDLEGDPGDAARVGLTAAVEIVAIEKSDALLLDNKTVRWAPTGPFAVVLDQGQQREQSLRLGRTDGLRIEILEGLRPGELVVLPPPPPAPVPAPGR